MRGKEIFLATLTGVASVAMAVAGITISETIEVKSVDTSTACTNGIKDSRSINGSLRAVKTELFSAGQVGKALVVTNSGTISNPSVIGGYFDTGSNYGPTTNIYARDRGTARYLWYTNSVYCISTVAGTTNNSLTNLAASITGTYKANSASITGIVIVTAWYAATDVDVRTAPAGHGPSRLIYSKSNLSTTNQVKYPVQLACSTTDGAFTNIFTELPICEPVRCRAYGATTTGDVFRTWLYYDGK